ncbi:hypothetical protein [Salipaludibacillus daqingensis]|uniref:hypothetical protein n=1 Tax=Salipaludibacillus daqingensis TaxID=3041001 RepID=UPI0024750034|nr:hypothetical protein [Salipaludibacillus daqingensis]
MENVMSRNMNERKGVFGLIISIALLSIGFASGSPFLFILFTISILTFSGVEKSKTKTIKVVAAILYAIMVVWLIYAAVSWFYDVLII